MLTIDDAKTIMELYDTLNTQAVKDSADSALCTFHNDFTKLAKEYNVDPLILKNQTIDLRLRMLDVVLSKVTDEQDLFTLGMAGICYDTNKNDNCVMDVGTKR